MSNDENPGDGSAPSDDLDQLARQYLDLWQDQLTALSANPAISEAMAGFFAKWSPAAAATAGPADQHDGGADASGPDASGLSDGGPANGAAAAGAASVAGGDRIGELLDRLDRIEERLVRLEQQRR